VKYPKQQTRTPRWAVGMRKLGPGLYFDGDGLHISEEELCEAMGVPYTPENCAVVESAALTAARAAFGLDLKVNHVINDSKGR
jgi:hypothetical protein